MKGATMKSYVKTNIIQGIICIAICAILIFICYSVIGNQNPARMINEKVESINGTVVSIDNAKVFGSPFLLGEGEYAYKFTYKVNNQTKIGWLKYGIGSKWIMDYKDN
jgi:Na+/proline symporter